MKTPETIQELDPTAVIRPGRFDPTVLMLLWCMRKTFFPLLWIGFIILTIAGKLGESSATELNSIDDFLTALFTPMVGIVAAIIVRLAVSGMAFASAYPLSRWNRHTDYAVGRRSRSRIRMWWDRLFLTRAYRSLRWTWAVRQAAIERLGETGRRLAWCDPVLRWMGIILFGALAAITVAVA